MIDTKRLSELLGYLNDLKNLQCSLHQPDGKEIFSASARSAYCDLLVAAEGGYDRCLKCDRAAVQRAIEEKVPFQYRCHAGAVDAAIPVIISGEAVLVILFGQLLDETPIEEQWEAARPHVAWYPDQERLREAFFQLPRFTQKEIKACYELVNACVSETKLEQMRSAGASQNVQRLEMYIENHFTEPLCVQDITNALGLSASRVCALANQIEPGMTIIKLLTQKRIATAKTLLRTTKATIREIAERVGIPDYNYFTKVFKKHTGKTPSQYRNSGA